MPAPGGPHRAPSPRFPWPFNHTKDVPLLCTGLLSVMWGWRDLASVVFVGKHGKVRAAPYFPVSHGWFLARGTEEGVRQGRWLIHKTISDMRL